MEKPTIDFLKELGANETTHESHPAAKRQRGFWAWLGKTSAIISTLFLVAVLAYGARAVISGQNLAAQFGNISVFSQLRHLVGADAKPLQGEAEDRINIALLGIGGANHEGGNLTDTIMVASIRPSDKSLALLSIPRDLVAPIPGIGWQKINSANAYGKQAQPNEPGAGPRLAEQTIEAITGLPIHYYIKIDFSGFTKIIDALGGVRVPVPQAFTDYEYPDNAYGYEPVSFAAGWQDLKGDRALQYVRSRHGNNNEGSDFARARRQQAVLEALQKRAMALSTLLNPNKIISLADIVGENMQTDMEIWESLKLFELAKQINTSAIKQVVLSSDNNGLLASDINPDGAYVLRPRAGADNFSEIKLAAQEIFSDTRNAADKAGEQIKKTRVAIQNGTTFPGLASRTAELLQTLSYQVTEVSNAPRRDYEKTVIYNLNDSDSNQDKAIQTLKKELNANIAPALPSYIEAPAADILIIVGADSIPSDILSLL
ncbi:MAG: LCP family protein [Patescibacteria group bacterium]